MVKSEHGFVVPAESCADSIPMTQVAHMQVGLQGILESRPIADEAVEEVTAELEVARGRSCYFASFAESIAGAMKPEAGSGLQALQVEMRLRTLAELVVSSSHRLVAAPVREPVARFEVDEHKRHKPDFHLQIALRLVLLASLTRPSSQAPQLLLSTS